VGLLGWAVQEGHREGGCEGIEARIDDVGGALDSDGEEHVGAGRFSERRKQDDAGGGAGGLKAECI
jgi:hypothetical protein